LLLRASALSIEFGEIVRQMFSARQREAAQTVVNNFSFNLAYSLGQSDHEYILERRRLESGEEVLTQRRSEVDILENVLGLSAVIGGMGWGHIQPDSIAFSFLSDTSIPFFVKFTVCHSVEAAAFLKNADSLHPHHSGREEDNPDDKEYMGEMMGESERRDEDKEKEKEKEKGSKGKKDYAEADEEAEKYSPTPVCVMLAGYINGYIKECLRITEESQKRNTREKGGKKSTVILNMMPLGQQQQHPQQPQQTHHAATKSRKVGAEIHAKLVVVEVACKAAGHQKCEFLLASVDTIEAQTKKYLEENRRLLKDDINNVLPLLKVVVSRYQDERTCSQLIREKI